MSQFRSLWFAAAIAAISAGAPAFAQDEGEDEPKGADMGGSDDDIVDADFEDLDDNKRA